MKNAAIFFVQTALLLRATWCAPLHAAFPTRQEYTNATVLKWTAMFGAVPFAEEHLFDCMHYVRPQPEAAFRPFTKEVLSKAYYWHFRGKTEEMFKAPLLDAVKGLKPSKYYLNEGRTEPSLFRYEFELESNRVVVLENLNTFFFTIRPPGFSTNSPVSGKFVSDLIHRWINVRGTSRVEVARSFNLPAQLRVGSVFANTQGTEVLEIGDGLDHVVGFVSTEGVCLILFKARADRAATGLPTNYKWVNQRIFEADGTTRMDHPKYFQPAQKPDGGKSP